MVVNSLTIKEHMVDVNSMIKPYEDSIKPKEKPQKKEAKRENKISCSIIYRCNSDCCTRFFF